MKLSRNLVILFLLLWATLLQAQVRPNTGSTQGRGSANSNDKEAQNQMLQQLPEGPDTTIVDYSYFDDLDKTYVYKDTLIDRSDRYNPAYNAGNEYFILGNLGSSSIPMRYQVKKKIGVDLGYHQYDLYNFNLDSIKLFKLNRPFNDLYFSPFDGESNFLVKAKFARRFSDGVSLHLNYNRINQNGIYQDQFVKTTNLSNSIFINRSRFKGLYTLLVNNNNQDHNGGISSPTFYLESFYNRRSRIPMILSDAEERKEQRILSFHNQVYLVEGKESSLSLQHHLLWENGSFRSSDDDINQDSSFYLSYWQDRRGIRHALSYRTLGNEFSIEAKKSSILNFKTGINHKNHKLAFAKKDSTITELSLFGRLKSNPGNFSLIANGEIGLGQIAGDFNFDGTLAFKTTWASASVGAQFYRFSPSIKSEYLEINQEEFYQYNWVKPVGTKLSFALEIPLVNLKLGLDQIVESNSIYWDSLNLPNQLEDVLSITQFSLMHKLRIGPIGLDHDILYQVNSSGQLALPSLMINQRAYSQFRLFEKKLEIQLGAELNYLSDYSAYRYFSLTGSFLNTNQQIDNYPMLNLFANIKVSKFRFFFRFDNLNSLWRTFPNYHILDQPLFDYNMRIGVRWILVD